MAKISVKYKHEERWAVLQLSPDTIRFLPKYSRRLFWPDKHSYLKTQSFNNEGVNDLGLWQNASPIYGHADTEGDQVIKLSNSWDWVRVEPDGKYSHRIYSKITPQWAMGFVTKSDSHY